MSRNTSVYLARTLSLKDILLMVAERSCFLLLLL